MPANEPLLPEQKNTLAKVQRKDAPGVKNALPQESVPIDPGSAPRTASQVIRLQQTVGNRATKQLIQQKARAGSIQTKLTVGPAHDAYEQEADRVAAQVMNTPAPAEKAQRAAQEEEEVQTKSLVQRAAEEEEELQTKPLVQRSSMDEEEVQTKPLVQRASMEEEEVQTKRLIQRASMEEEEVQTKPLVQRAAEEEEELQTKRLIQRSGDGSFEAGADVEQRLESQSGGGTPLPAETRSFMEPRFGADFGSVRMHTDSGAAQLSQDLNAQAFTKGADIFMGAGKYNPGTSSGDELLAHELTHVVQQGGAPTKEEQKAE